MKEDKLVILDSVDSWTNAIPGGAILATAGKLFSSLSPIVQTVPLLIVTDSVMGMVVALLDDKFTTEKFRTMTIKKFASYFGLAVVAVAVGYATGISAIGQSVAYIIFVKESLSIISNVLALGVVKKEEIGFITQLLEALKPNR